MTWSHNEVWVPDIKHYGCAQCFALTFSYCNFVNLHVMEIDYTFQSRNTNFNLIVACQHNQPYGNTWIRLTEVQ